MEHPNATLMRMVDEALLAGDFPGFLALHTEDAGHAHPGQGPLSGDHYGRDGIAAVFQQEMAMLDAPPGIVPLDDLGSDDHAGAILLRRMQRAGRIYEGLQVVIARVRGGQLSEISFRRKTKPHSTNSSPNA